jgi:hypothetical protein
MANYHVSLLCGVVCAAAMPSTDGHSGVGVALAAACAMHAVTFRPRPGRWTAVAVPSLLWVLWWPTLGDETRPVHSLSILSALDDVADGVFSSFGALTRGWWAGGAVLLTGWVALLVHRVRTDRASALTQLAWAAGLVTWWVGLVWSRPGAADSFDTLRYKYVGAVLILLSALPASPSASLRTARAPVAYDRSRVGGHWGHHPGQPRRPVARRARQGGGRGESRDGPVRDGADGRANRADARRLIPELARITVHDYEQEVARYGSPIDTRRSPYEALIGRHGLQVAIVGSAPASGPTCVALRVSRRLGDEVTLHTGDQRAMVRARRFGAELVDVRRVAPHRSAVVRFPGPTIVEGVQWIVEAPGACIHVAAPAPVVVSRRLPQGPPRIAR